MSDINNQVCEMQKFLVRWVGKMSKTMRQRENNTARKKLEEIRALIFDTAISDRLCWSPSAKCQ